MQLFRSIGLERAWILYVAVFVQGIGGLLCGIRSQTEIQGAKWRMSSLIAYAGLLFSFGNVALSIYLLLQA